MATTTTKATPTKLRSGEWGARVQGKVSEGDVITITTRSGKSWDATVRKVVWSDGDVSIVATSSAPSRPASPWTSSRGQYGVTHCGGRCPVRGHRCTYDDPCHDCI